VATGQPEFILLTSILFITMQFTRQTSSLTSIKRSDKTHGDRVLNPFLSADRDCLLHDDRRSSDRRENGVRSELQKLGVPQQSPAGGWRSQCPNALEKASWC
jgi:hypothetical protein